MQVLKEFVSYIIYLSKILRSNIWIYVEILRKDILLIKEYCNIYKVKVNIYVVK